MTAYDRCKWAVAYKIDGKNYDDGKERTNVTELFDYPHLAEDFIKKVLLAETQDRFFVIHIDNLANQL